MKQTKRDEKLNTPHRLDSCSYNQLYTKRINQSHHSIYNYYRMFRDTLYIDFRHWEHYSVYQLRILIVIEIWHHNRLCSVESAILSEFDTVPLSLVSFLIVLAGSVQQLKCLKCCANYHILHLFQSRFNKYFQKKLNIYLQLYMPHTVVLIIYFRSYFYCPMYG